MDKKYVSDFTKFMDQYLDQHPEVVEEQRRNWRSFWDLKLKPSAQPPSKDDLVPDDHYGFL